MKHAALFLPVLATLAACGASGPAANNQVAGNAVANVAAPTNTGSSNGAAAASGPLSAYVGHLPSEAVNGSTFLANLQVRAAVEAAVTDAAVRRWVLREDVTSNPISMREGQLFASGCESHNCGRHWTIEIDPAGTAAHVCYSTDGAASQHFAAGHAAERREGLCPRTDGG